MTDKPTYAELEARIADLEREAEQLRRDRQRFETVLNGLNVAVYVADVETEEILLINTAMRTIYGDVVGRTCSEVLGGARSEAAPMSSLAGLASHPSDAATLVTECFDNDRGVWFEFRDQALPWTDGRPARLTIAVDITERKRTHEMLMQSEKMVSVGGLAAGMAHEINNPLAGIIQNIQVLRLRLAGDKPANIESAAACGTSMEQIGNYFESRSLYRVMDAIVTSGERAARIVENMLSFARKSDESFQPFDVARLLDTTLEIAQTDYDLTTRYDFDQIEIEREYDPSVTKVICSGNKMQQVFLNILLNGAEAMAGDPDRLTKGAPRFVLRVSSDDKLATIEIEDNGPGMNAETCKRVFEPFFSATSGAAGTGLGLSISYFIVTENHGGAMRVESQLGQGTKFVIKLVLMSALLQ